ncbi:hypothetical protein NM208_g4773 [Fusarium decemcellulare]|uniref:Uncharacterized protein n=1 Tax=Fusarium decemcellulare TaxID=57161 RepID=A0ACC1SJN4_9HYPO|nr:hypothetical protein NM208_g4773 [Fusarium decemcellulare]
MCFHMWKAVAHRDGLGLSQETKTGLNLLSSAMGESMSTPKIARNLPDLEFFTMDVAEGDVWGDGVLDGIADLWGE